MPDVTIDSSFELDVRAGPFFGRENNFLISTIQPQIASTSLIISTIDNAYGSMVISTIVPYGVISNALAIPSFPGTVELFWDCDDEEVETYDIYISYDNLTYTEIEINVPNKSIVLYGMPADTDMYFRVVGVYQDGSKTNVKQFKLGESVAKTVDIKFVAITQSIILENSIIPFRINEEDTILLQTGDEIQF